MFSARTGVGHSRRVDDHATLVLAGGVPVEVVSTRLGHSRITTTTGLKVHPDDAQQRAASDTFGRLLSQDGAG